MAAHQSTPAAIFGGPSGGAGVPSLPAALSVGGPSAFSPLASASVAPAVLPAALLAQSGPDGSPTYRPAVISYRTVQSDTIETIAAKFSISPSTIRSANPHLPRKLKSGLELSIPPVSGTVYKLAAGEDLGSILDKYNLGVEDFSRANPGLALQDVVAGSQILIPGDRLPSLVRASAVRSTVSDLQIPTHGYDWGVLHNQNAVDIANSCGAQVVAAADGVVVSDPRYRDGASGWNGGYGTFLLIEHANGVRTRYAHLESVSVAIGDVVKKGEVIGAVGKTGEATGCHVHFEVIGAENPFAKK